MAAYVCIQWHPTQVAIFCKAVFTQCIWLSMQKQLGKSQRQMLFPSREGKRAGETQTKVQCWFVVAHAFPCWSNSVPLSSFSYNLAKIKNINKRNFLDFKHFAATILHPHKQSSAARIWGSRMVQRKHLIWSTNYLNVFDPITNWMYLIWWLDVFDPMTNWMHLYLIDWLSCLVIRTSIRLVFLTSHNPDLSKQKPLVLIIPVQPAMTRPDLGCR